MVDITWLDIIESISTLAMESYVQLVRRARLKGLLSDVKIAKSLYIRCPCVSVSVAFSLLSS